MYPTKHAFFTIIMPVYNAGKFLEEAINSLLYQEFSDWQLICINDGSTDNSGEILEGFSYIYENIIVLNIKQSGSAAAARNTALPYVNGRFIIELDADDKLAYNSLEILKDRIVESQSDIVLFNLKFWDFKNEIITEEIKGINGDTNETISGELAFRLSLDWTIGGFGAVRNDIVQKYRYSEEGMNGDEFSTRLFFLNSASVSFSEAAYLYRKNDESTTKKISTNTYKIFETNLNLLKLTYEYEKLVDLRVHLYDEYLNSLVDKYREFQKQKNLFSKDEKDELLSYFSYHLGKMKEYSSGSGIKSYLKYQLMNMLLS